jgi:glycosyltransferase involved in cell wall biosynthesis
LNERASTGDRPLVTIAIPTYNRADKTLADTLRSALAQTYPNTEVLVSDNCSTDNTEAVVRAIDPRVRYVRQPENLGLNGNLNQCAALANGDYVLVLHDDDLIDPDFVEACMDAVADSTTVGLVRTGIRIIASDGRVLFERPNTAVASASVADLMFAWFKNETAQYCCNTLYNTRALREVGGFASHHNLFQDALAQVKVAAKYGHAHVKAPKASWRRHDGNAGSVARASIEKWCIDSLQVLDEMCAREPTRAAALREQGARYFCEMNYRYVPQIGTAFGRLAGYLMVARHFRFARSPVGPIYESDIRPHLRALKRLLIGQPSQA